MAHSTTGIAGKNKSTPPPRTPGPLGSNKDAADPSTAKWFKGDTPGPLGRNDHADPDETICRLRTSIGGIPQAATLADNPDRLEIQPLERMSTAKFEQMPDGATRKAWILKKLGPYQKQLHESAENHKIPVQLLATVIANELIDIDVGDQIQDELGTAGSVGMAQIQVQTALRDDLIPHDQSYLYAKALGMEQPFVAGRLKTVQYAINAAAKEIRIQLDRIKANPGSEWVKKFKFDGAKASGGQGAYDGFVEGTQPEKEKQLAELVIAAYNSPDIVIAKNPEGYGNGTRHARNGATLAEVLFIWGLFRPVCK